MDLVLMTLKKNTYCDTIPLLRQEFFYSKLLAAGSQN
jgi:hypothetical protein